MSPNSFFSSNAGFESQDILTVKRCLDEVPVPTNPPVTPTLTPVVTPTIIPIDGVYSWGSNSAGQLGINSDIVSGIYPTKISDANTTTVIKSARDHNLVLHNGDIYYMGTNENMLSQSGTVVTNITKLTVDIADSTTWNRIATNTHHSLVVSTTGAVYGFSNDYNYGSTGHTAQTGTFTQVAVTGGVHFVGAEIAAGQFHSLAIGADANIYAWGRNHVGQFANNSIQSGDAHHQAAVVSGVTNVTHIYTNSSTHACFAINTSGTLYSWGGVQDTGNPTSGTSYILARTDTDGTAANPLLVGEVSLPQRARYFSTGNDLNISILKDYSFHMWGQFYDTDGTLQTLDAAKPIIDNTTLEPIQGFRVACQTHNYNTFRAALFVGFDTKVYFLIPMSYDGIYVKAALQKISDDLNISSISSGPDHYMAIKLNTANIYSLPRLDSLIGEVI